MTVDKRPLQELGSFLRACRLRVNPESKGLPAGRRRTPGLRREEVAILASISSSWYTYLEQGRDIRPSEPVLNALADVLELTPAERRYMHLLALGGAPHRDQPVTEEAVGEIELLVRSLDPHPAYAGDGRGDILAWNDACSEWIVDFATIPREERNAILWVATAPQARERFVEWEVEARDVVSRLRSAVASNAPQDQRLREIVRRLRTTPHGREWWDEHAVSQVTFRQRRLRHPVLGEQTFQMFVLLVAGADNVGIVVHVPPVGARIR